QVHDRRRQKQQKTNPPGLSRRPIRMLHRHISATCLLWCRKKDAADSRIRALVSGMPGVSARGTKPLRIMSAGSVLAVSAARRVRARVECLLDDVDTEPRSRGQFQSTLRKFRRMCQKLSCQLLFRLRSNRLQDE